MLHLSDGGEVSLDWQANTVQNGSPVVILLPGLTGSSDSEYIKSFVFEISATGAACVVFNYRGKGGVPLKVSDFFSCLLVLYSILAAGNVEI